MVELVVVLPILLIVLFAFVELSRAWFTLQIAMMAAREGARAAAVAPLTFEATDGQARIDAVFADYNFSTTSPGFSRTVTKAAITGTTDFEVAATVNVRFSTLFPVLLPRLQTIDMSEQVKMRYECNPSIKPCSPPP
jgi:Flp pilus assembly protein TadG